jgi:SpoVK/Ycf46/Vps4 family AAA+-type ATPase
MRSDLIKSLFKAHAEKDDTKFLDIANEIISEESNKKHNLFAKELQDVLNKSNQINYHIDSLSRRYKQNIPLPRDSEKGFPLLELREYHCSFNDLILNQEVSEKLMTMVDEFQHQELLKSYGLKPRQRILFCGPPGTGKTLSAKVISSELGLPLIYVRFDSIVSSYLGETATNLNKIFEFIEKGTWVVLFDEFDIIGKKRDDPYEHGEIKRVVNNFMQMLDNFKGQSLIIAATNHPQLLDTAIWRRFNDIINFDLPDIDRRYNLFNHYLKIFKRADDLDIEKFSKLTSEFSPADISQICEDTLRKIILKNDLIITNEDILISIEQQSKRKEIIRNN